MKIMDKIHYIFQYLIYVFVIAMVWSIFDFILGSSINNATNVLIFAFVTLWCVDKERTR